MTTRDTPAITMRVEQGRLVPASSYDLELLQQWRDGATLHVSVIPTALRADERKYFKMLSEVIKRYRTPWLDVEDAHRKLKEETGFVTPQKRADGSWGSVSRAISSFTDKELAEYIAIFSVIVRARFGIDPATLLDPHQSSDAAASRTGAAVGDGPDASPIPAGAGFPSPPATNTGGVPAAGGMGESIPRTVSPANGPSIDDEWAWLKQTARMLVASAEPGGDTRIVDRQMQSIKDYHWLPGASKHTIESARAIYRHCRAVCRKEEVYSPDWVAGVAHCQLDDLQPGAR